MRTLVVLPTYQEADNIAEVLGRLRAAVPDADVLVEMDSDLSHDPAALPSLLAALDDGADLAIGSRYIPGGSIPRWSASRRALSRWGNRYAAFMLRLDVRDATYGFRAYRASA